MTALSAGRKPLDQLPIWEYLQRGVFPPETDGVLNDLSVSGFAVFDLLQAPNNFFLTKVSLKPFAQPSAIGECHQVLDLHAPYIDFVR